MKIVITGGPGTGKTSIINKLENIGHSVFHESSREIIKKYKELGHVQLFLSNPIKFSELLLEKRSLQFIQSVEKNDKFCFFDRGIPDILAYLNYKKIKGCGLNGFDDDSPKVVQKIYQFCLIEQFRYDLVFILEPWLEIYKNDEQRYESFDEVVKIDKSIKETYSKLGWKYIIVPKDKLDKRVDFIISKLSSEI